MDCGAFHELTEVSLSHCIYEGTLYTNHMYMKSETSTIGQTECRGLIVHGVAWNKVVRANYKTGGELIPNVVPKKGASNFWRGVRNVWPMASDCMYWNIGDGTQVRFWLIHGCREFEQSWRDWDLEEVRGLIPVQVYDSVVGHAPPSLQVEQDIVAWQGTSDGSFSMKTAYQKLIPTLESVMYPLELLSKQPSMICVLCVTEEEGPSSYIYMETVKLNCDGALSLSNGTASCGGVLGDYAGKFLMAFSCNLGRCSVLEAELWFCLIQSFVTDEAVLVETDLALAAQLMNEGCIRTHPCHSLVNSVASMTREDQDVS
ncbi:hypothetical protein Fmac_026023 [Flemingia macrophylla]|uniref:RNase H type-1 domain-containing protein n=1 Tax=Flemingia macrophylla TaxID=520843 RepID=A0ABD1LDP1_9FABA